METPTAIERRYVTSGYRLPQGWDWSQVHHKRAANGLADYAVPLTEGGKVVRWGTYLKP